MLDKKDIVDLYNSSIFLIDNDVLTNCNFYVYERLRNNIVVLFEELLEARKIEYDDWKDSL